MAVLDAYNLNMRILLTEPDDEGTWSWMKIMELVDFEENEKAPALISFKAVNDE